MTRFAIISDVHAFEPEPLTNPGREGDASWVRSLPTAVEQQRAPFHALERLIRDEVLQADYVLSCGDMGDKADFAGISYTWSWLETIRRRLGAEKVFATTGNHDVDSYDQTGRQNPLLATQSLQPPFPTDDARIVEQYWRDHVALVSEPPVDLIILNSSANHATREEAEQGRLSDETMAKLTEIVNSTTNPLRILLCHHHPYRHDAIDRTDYSALEAGPELLRLLESNGDWLVVHGHRHYPNLVYAGGGVRAPVILAAGSFAALLYPELQGRVRNQFHILDLEGPAVIDGTSGMCGRVRSWEYNWAQGWTRPNSMEGIPDGAGFGYRNGIPRVVDRLTELLSQRQPNAFIPLAELLMEAPELGYLLPHDRARALEELERSRVARVSPQMTFFLKPDEILLRFVGRPGGA